MVTGGKGSSGSGAVVEKAVRCGRRREREGEGEVR
jgi:hypothetical protein